ncbi:peptidase [Streptomyces albidus (ex Kaewkla and Franco 2022)]|uniref:peptidase n=1 Tax=Streptomyces albidus (ex Kaewkla and Franco 2022) TaxID=722709 RepID=UPI002816487D|nr:peptidase [Streptomyces albidus (ex Kaewkla and Franco 2022)]
MDIRTPPVPLSLPEGEEIAGRFSEQLAAVVAAARRRATRGGDRVLDTAHLLHSLLEWDPVVRAFLGGGGPQTAKLLGYLAQRPIGYGLRWRGAVEEPGVPRAGSALPPALPGWSPAAVSALGAALERATGRGLARVEGVDLLAGLTVDGGCRAAKVLTDSGFDAERLSSVLDVRGERGDTPVVR